MVYFKRALVVTGVVVGALASIAGSASADPVATVDPSSAERISSSAGSSPDSDPAAQAYTRGFTLTNLSGYTLRVQGYDNLDKDDQMPALGTVIRPGDKVNHFEVVWLWLQNHTVKVRFDVLDGSGATVGTAAVNLTVTSDLADTRQSSSWEGGPDLGTGWQEGALDVYYADPAGTRIDVPADAKQRQAQVLEQVCMSGRATCTFTPTKRDIHGWTGYHQIGIAYGNRRTTPITKTFEVSTVESTKQSVELSGSVSVAIKHLIEASIKATYKGSITQEIGYSERTELQLTPGMMTWPTGNFPVIKDTGDFLVTMGNTTWDLKGITLSHPDPSRYPSIVWDEAPIGGGHGEVHDLPGGDESGDAQVLNASF